MCWCCRSLQKDITGATRPKDSRPSWLGVSVSASSRSNILLRRTSPSARKRANWSARSCILVASDAIGSVPYLVKPNVSGILFRAPRVSSSFSSPDLSALDSLCDKVRYLFDHPSKLQDISRSGVKQMQDIWSPQVAAHRLLRLVECLQQGIDPGFEGGPCSKA